MRLESVPPQGDLKNVWSYLVRVLNGGLTLKDNMDGRTVTYTSNATPDTQDTVPHGMKRTPTGFLVTSINKAGVVYKSAAFDATNIYLKCNVASATVTLFVV